MTPYYQDDAVTLYLGDCRDILPQLEAVDHVITDPPYSRDVYLRMRKVDSGAGRLKTMRVNVGSGLRKMAAGDIGAVDDLVVPVATEIARLVKRWAIVFSDVEFCSEWRAALEAGGLRYVRTGAWAKPDAMPQMTGDRPGVGFEPCTIAHRVGGKMRWNGGGRLALWSHGTVKGDRPDHPCPKPEPLMRDLVWDFTDGDDVILDPFSGSGTTAVAAKRLGRRCVAIESNEQHCENQAKRLQATDLDERYVRIPGRRGKQGAMDFGGVA